MLGQYIGGNWGGLDGEPRPTLPAALECMNYPVSLQDSHSNIA
jgi:hypothetical protein